MKKYTIKYGNIPVTKQKVCCKITGTVQKTIIKKWNISDEIIVEVYRYMENELFEKAPVHKAYFNMALPLVFSMVISLVYNMVDTFFIARTGNTNLVAGVTWSTDVHGYDRTWRYLRTGWKFCDRKIIRTEER